MCVCAYSWFLIRYVAFLLESPAVMTFARFPEFSGFFNWTMTYRREDSDIYAPYGYISPKASQGKHNEAEGK